MTIVITLDTIAHALMIWGVVSLVGSLLSGLACWLSQPLGGEGRVYYRRPVRVLSPEEIEENRRQNQKLLKILLVWPVAVVAPFALAGGVVWLAHLLDVDIRGNITVCREHCLYRSGY